MEEIITIVILIASVVLHEMAHGYAANALGDPTARLQGRLSGNPLVHIDPLGSVIIPAFLFLSHAGILFGWAKPVPYNPYNLRNQRWGEALVAIAGPATNILLALIFGLIIRLSGWIDISPTFLQICLNIVILNIFLALFNMLPVPPLDGSKVLTALLPASLRMDYLKFVRFIERYGIFAMFAFLFIFMQFASGPFGAFVTAVTRIITGM